MLTRLSSLRASRRIAIALYAVVLFGPVAFVLLGRNPGNTTTVTLFAVSLGWIAFSAIVLQTLLPSRVTPLATAFGADLLLRFHRVMGLAVLLLVSVHVAVLVIDNPDRLGQVVAGSAGYLAGAAGLLALAAMIGTSWPEARGFGSYEAWRVVHALLAITVVASVFIHALLTGHHAASGWVRWAAFALAATAAIALFVTRIVRPFAQARHPYRLLEVRPERGGAITLTIEPTTARRISFRPGQFAWLRFGPRVYTTTEHPFSFTSPAGAETLSFTIKPAGDFTRTVSELEPGHPVAVDGPHGSFRPPLADAGYVLIVAGSGIAPAMSIIRTVVQSGNHQPIQLVYGSRELHETTFLDELAELAQGQQIDMVLVLSQPPQDWTGPRGRIDKELLSQRLTPDAHDRNIFVCGPGSMVDEILMALEALGINRTRVHGERF